MNEPHQDAYSREVAEAKLDLMLMKHPNYPNISSAFIKEMALVLRLQELEDKQAATTLT